MRAILTWSDGTTIYNTIFEDKDGKTGYERAIEHMHKEYDSHNYGQDADADYGAFRGKAQCVYAANDKDTCIWDVTKIPEEKPRVSEVQMSQIDRSELFGRLIDAVEDFLEEKGVTTDMLSNDEREGEGSALIYGSDYDNLADRLSIALGIDRDVPIEKEESDEGMER